ncbi:DUF459 domain-containing protein [Pseudovibrio sp. SPO723]|uniref:SGNH/GDSL hydrolase family protein n=1 Tax=Nesiotobacter zosterae TaxID=392721 RepID=UPI0029C5EFDB|nr:DUF459 domain-containing protein [Pseudovibrio sp. SPO723]MDX5594712.1 DUF459 domain-containing protein [Pseudovibrio sp. SPO723]
MAGFVVMRHSVVFKVLALALCFAVAEPILITEAHHAYAQSRERGSSGGGFFSKLFGGIFKPKQQTRERKIKQRSPSRTTKRRSTRPTQRAAPVAPQINEEPKNDDAKVLLVVGDDLAGGLADGLRAVYAKTPSIRVKKLVYPSTGLVQDKSPDWPEDVSKTLALEDVGLVVVSLGAKDDAGIRFGEQEVAFQSPEWMKQYRFRVASLVASIRNEQLPMIWVGLAPAEDYLKTANYSLINDLYMEQVEPSGGIFVDIWDAYLDENGVYTSHGPDINGKRTRLRSRDGVFFTWDGYRKMAFFVEREIARVFGSASAFIFEGVKDDPNFMVLTGRLTSPETKLISNSDEKQKPVPGTAQHKLTVSGADLPNVTGRVDENRWPIF